MRLLFAPLVLLGGCNSVFYQPMEGVYATPDRVEVEFDEHFIDTTDGVTLHVWHLKPDDAKRRDAVVLHLHGNAENMTSHFLYVAWLAKEGFDVVTFDYRGYGQSTGTPARAGLVRDAYAVVDWTRHTPGLAGKPLVLFGQSLGGAVAVPTVVLAREQKVPLLVALAVECTFESYRDVARGKLGSFWLTWPFQYPLSWTISDELSPIDVVGKLDLPLLVIHSKADPVVPMAHGRRLFEAAKVADKEFWEVPSNIHTVAFAGEKSPYRTRFVAWLCRVTKAKGC